jgi:hypothetical protein
MISTVLLPFYVEIFIELALSAGAVAYAYRLSKLTGRFGAWTLIIVGLVLLTFQNVNSLWTILTLPQNQLASLVQQFNAYSLAISAAFSIGVPGVFFFAMMKLYQSFAAQKPKERNQKRIAEEKAVEN